MIYKLLDDIFLIICKIFDKFEEFLRKHGIKREIIYFTDERNCDSCKYESFLENKMCKKCSAYHNNYKQRKR
jgi:hypothetical protein